MFEILITGEMVKGRRYIPQGMGSLFDLPPEAFEAAHPRVPSGPHAGEFAAKMGANAPARTPRSPKPPPTHGTIDDASRFRDPFDSSFWQEPRMVHPFWNKPRIDNPIAPPEVRKPVAGHYPPVHKNAMQTILGVETANYKHPVERFVACLPDGSMVGAFEGTEDSCRIGQDCIDALAAHPGGIVTHNHPSAWREPEHGGPGGTSFSMEDIGVTVQLHLSEMRAVSPGYVHVMRPPKDGWPGTWQQISDYLFNLDRDVRRDFTARIQGGEMTVQQAQGGHSHELMTRFAAGTNAQYLRVPIPEEFRKSVQSPDLIRYEKAKDGMWIDHVPLRPYKKRKQRPVVRGLRKSIGTDPITGLVAWDDRVCNGTWV
jgi:hypothetical protein